MFTDTSTARAGRKAFQERLVGLFGSQVAVDGNFVVGSGISVFENQRQTNDAFTEKWDRYEQETDQEKLYAFQRNWYLTLYGFADEESLKDHLRGFDVILDAGCGLGYKAAWFADLAPHALVLGMDFSNSARQAASRYANAENLFFMQGDISNTGLRDDVIGYVSCDQVIMHTEDPVQTFAELSRVAAKPGGEVACYFYAKKALPRELLDDHFRLACKTMTHAELWMLAEQLTELGRTLSELHVEVDVPDIPALGIKGGRYDIQRFIYWNSFKCFWNEQLGWATSVATNFDWYSPSNARRFSESEVLGLVAANGMLVRYFHREEACYSGRFCFPSPHRRETPQCS